MSSLWFWSTTSRVGGATCVRPPEMAFKFQSRRDELRRDKWRRIATVDIDDPRTAAEKQLGAVGWLMRGYVLGWLGVPLHVLERANAKRGMHNKKRREQPAARAH